MTIREQLGLNSWWAEIVHEAFDDFYPKQEGGSEERSNALAVQGVLAIKMIPAIESLISNAKEEERRSIAKDFQESTSDTLHIPRWRELHPDDSVAHDGEFAHNMLASALEQEHEHNNQLQEQLDVLHRGTFKAYSDIATLEKRIEELEIYIRKELLNIAMDRAFVLSSPTFPKGENN